MPGHDEFERVEWVDEFMRSYGRKPMTDKELQKELARSLRGKFVRFAHESPTAAGYLVVSVNDDGMLELQGWSGLFAPHVFVRVDRSPGVSQVNC